MSKHLTLSHLQTILPPIKHLIDKKAEAVDWNENDPSAKGYVKNRPFYESEHLGIKYILPEITISSFEEQIPLTEPLIEGVTYLVTWNGIEYKCLAKNYDGYIMIGNNAIYEYDNGIEDDTGEPFAAEAPEGSPALWIYTNETNFTIAIAVDNITTIIKKIDPKFLPEPGQGTNIGAAGTGEGAEIFNDYENNIASSDYSHAEGKNTEASGSYSHTEGYMTSARGECSHAEGGNTTAAGKYQHVQGRNNIRDENNTYLHIVGNGGFTDGQTSVVYYSNAHTLDWNGNAWYQGDVFVGGTDQDSGERLAKMSDLAASITIDEINAICGVTLGINELIDETSGATYQLYVDSGKLSMREVE